ncbi:Lar family restriction alleviation protein [Azospira restricta]|uniref:Restriction alleviation protein, Lar family n=1 Tax=Azospira restricta TaxID=404405 RepID=A0A974PXQ2_9RHOO|nr:Lar family restriction alleviation protein [Azospira restricta]QRJ63330.1 restriction alleviation protein, Lar family [Azospira restricta]
MTAAAADYLQPCPFCGTAPASAIEVDLAMWAVVCNHCQSIGPLAGDERRAAELWNRRPPA